MIAGMAMPESLKANPTTASTPAPATHAHTPATRRTRSARNPWGGGPATPGR